MSDKETAGIESTVSNSELIEALEALGLTFRRESGKAVTDEEQQEEKQWCCIVEGDKMPDCVLDYNAPNDCVHAHKFNKREECPFWKLA